MAAFNYKTGAKGSISDVIFAKYDADGSGQLSYVRACELEQQQRKAARTSFRCCVQDEFRSLCYDKGHCLSDAELEAAVASLDPESAGTISKEAFQEFWRSDTRFTALQLSEAQEAFIAQVTELFRGADADDSGHVDTMEEWEDLYARLVTGGFVQHHLVSGGDLWSALDVDGSDSVSFSEFLRWMLKHNGHPYPDPASATGVTVLGRHGALADMVFSKYDLNSDAILSKDEFKALAYDKGHFLSDEELDAALASMAGQVDGGITMEAFNAWWAKGGDRWASLGLTEDQRAIITALSQCFQWFDADQDGYLSAEEWPDCHAQLVEYEYAQAEEAGGPSSDALFASIDKDGNGYISANEFLAYCIEKGALSGSLEAA